ncbi:glycosyltransferase [Synechococcus sp. CS-1325]|nr:glycosyltransferase [Synechococcus sp. CS-1325]
MLASREPAAVVDVLILIHSFAAEGCPQLALLLCRHWERHGIRPVLVLLESEPQDLRSEFEALSMPVCTLALGQGQGRYPRLIWQIFRLCRRHRPAAVLSFPLGWHACIAWGAKLSGVKRVCAHVGNLPPVWTGHAFGKFKALVQLGRPVTHRLLCCSDYIRDATVRDFGVRPTETVAIYNACDLEAFASLKRLPHAHHHPRLGMVARLEQHKDQPTLIRAVTLLRQRGVDVEVWLIGEGSQRLALERLIAELELADRVKLLGSRRDIPKLLNQLDLFVFAAKPDEGFGIALAEAMAVGLPIVATDVGACREVLEDGLLGRLVPPGDPAALAAGIREVLADPLAAGRCAERARVRALRDFSVEAMAQAYGRELGLSVA